MIKTWRNGASGAEVKKVIDYNFNLVSRYLSKDIKALTTQERNLLPSDYLKNNTLVFDIDEMQWYKYSISQNNWIETSVDDNIYEQQFSISDWEDGVIRISEKDYRVVDPIIEVFAQDGMEMLPVVVDIKKVLGSDIILSTDLPFDGKVVIK